MTDETTDDSTPTARSVRRRSLLGAVGLGTLAALAGCSDSATGQRTSPTPSRGTATSAGTETATRSTADAADDTEGPCRAVDVDEIPMAATVDRGIEGITVTGAIRTNATIIRVRIPDVPAGTWTITKAEVNYTDDPWRGWEIVFGDGTTVSEGTGATSRQFRAVRSVEERNALVFHDGRVLPGEPVLKRFEVEHAARGDVVMSHHRVFSEPTGEQIREGFPERPVTEVELETRFVE